MNILYIYTCQDFILNHPKPTIMQKMSYCTLLVIFLFAILPLHSQVVTRGSNKSEFITISTSPLIVVLTGEADFDSSFVSAVKKGWTLTPYEFMGSKEANKIVRDETKSFLLPMSVVVRFGSGTDPFAYSASKMWLILVKGGKKSLDKYIDNDAIVYSPFSQFGDESEYEDATYRLEYMVAGINDAIAITKKEEINGGMTLPITVMDAINKAKSSVIKTKTLVMNRDLKNLHEQYVFDDKLFEDNYDYKYEFVSDAEFREIMLGTSDEYLCLFPAIDANKYVFIYEPSTRGTVYAHWVMQGMKFSSKDMNKLVEVIK